MKTLKDIESLMEEYGLSEFYEEIKKRKPYALFLDVHFPDENGLDILKHVKEEWPEIRVVMLTADMSEETKQTAEESGAEYFIYKPFPHEHLYEALRAIGAYENER